MKITLGGLLLHDGANPDSRRIFRPLDIWDKTPGLDALLVPNAGGQGARLAGDWRLREKYGTLSGRAETGDRVSYNDFRRQLLAAVPVGTETELVVEEDDGSKLRMFVLRWDEIDPQWFRDRWTAYTLPLVAPDPGKYALTPVGGTVGVFTGETWFRHYTVDTVPNPDVWLRRYSDGNLVSNWSFEVDMADWESNTVFGTLTACGFAQSNVRADHGAWSALVTWPNTGGSLGSLFNTTVSDLIPGVSYTATFRCWVPSGSPDVRADAVFHAVGSSVSTKDAWVDVPVTFVASGESAFVGVEVASATAGQQVWVDSVRVAFTGATPPWHRKYEQAQALDDLPQSVQLFSGGDEESERVVVEVTGPLTAGEWYVTEEGSGERMWAELSLVAGQSLVFDSYAKKVTLNDVDVSDFMFGEWLRLPPGTSTWRLVGGLASAGFASISGLPRYS